MSDRRRQSHSSHSPEAIVLERNPQVRTYRILRPKSPERERLTIGSKLYNLFRTRKKRVHIIEEAPVRSRRPERIVRTPSPTPSPSPSPPRGPYHIMSSKFEDDIYAPLPPKLPPKSKQAKDDPIEYVVEERSPRFRKVKIVPGDRDDEDAYPRVESRSPSRKRDSGKYRYTDGHVAEEIGRGRKEYERRRPDPEVQKLVDDLARERRERREAERAAAAAEDQANRLKADLAHEKRQRSLERRERAIAEREKRLGQEQDRLELRRPRDRQDVVVVQNPAVVPIHDPGRSALDRARADYERTHQDERLVREERRPGTGERRSRVIIVGNERDRDRGHGRR
ncbi:uncharacterized protein Z518_09411 [Rhinocladiella mackenziei CBS 650.93]|uniref:Uncharacterized protein n=1 Tax=Rhinocladiella mackenziei CBS 650.93 TaxID=1442369 RepID=A0A0D2IYJ6_9EURO|nr:uncharacterized protein Z518_09411 [Rhinocladiella mackenziei CBS 650.93]KIX01685.1 hypothetical protein Z518_09411 [Rhinocladiella mackenziei CBS 650.93]